MDGPISTPRDIALTEPEERLLDHMRDSRIDAEIAVRLGLSTADVQRRIETILAKTGLPDREALREWSRSPFTVVREPDPVSEAPSARNETPRAWIWPAIGLAVTLFLAFAILGAWVGRQGKSSASPGEDEDVTPTPTAAAASNDPTPVPPGPPAMNGVPIAAVTVFQGYTRLGSGIELIVLRASTHDQSTSLVRYFADKSGAAITEVLYTPPEASRIRNAIADEDGSELALAVAGDVPGCQSPVCAGTAIDGHTTFLRSHDAGVTWETVGVDDSPYALVQAFLGDAIVAGRPYPSGIGGAQYSSAMDIEDFLVPADPSFVSAGVNVTPIQAGPRTIAWKPDGGTPVFDAHGNVLLDFGFDGFATATDVHYDSAGYSATASWFDVRAGTTNPVATRYFAAKYESAGEPANHLWAFSYPVVIKGWLDEQTAIVDLGDETTRQADLGPSRQPAFFDVANGFVAPFSLERPDREFALDTVVAVRPGPFLRVSATDDGDCVPMRDAASANARSLACYASGVRLANVSAASGERPVENDGVSWVRVALRHSQFGYVNREFLSDE